MVYVLERHHVQGMIDNAVDVLRVEIQQLKKSVEESGRIERDSIRPIYFVSDLAEVMQMKPDTIRRNYINTGLIKARRPEGSNRLQITPEEYQRVAEEYRHVGRLR